MISKQPLDVAYGITKYIKVYLTTWTPESMYGTDKKVSSIHFFEKKRPNLISHI